MTEDAQRDPLEIGAKVAYLGACYIVRKIDGGELLIRPLRRSYSSGLPHAAKVKASEVAAWTPKPKVSPDAKTCQICSRPIHAASGVIAHHGYERPSQLPGYQTDSCYGARFQPFEVSRDRLGWYIENVAAPSFEAAKAERALLDKPGVAVPGPEYTSNLRGLDGKLIRQTMRVGLDWDGMRPDGRRDAYTYADYLRFAIARADQDVSMSERHLNDQRGRFDAWKPADASS
jgi:hypothetical protein